MRVLVLEPGPNFSVQDVYRGWLDGLRQAGAKVEGFNFSNRLQVYAESHTKLEDGKYVKSFTDDEAVAMAATGISAACWEYLPDVVVIVSGFYVVPWMMDLIRARGRKIVLIHTESPYEDDKQLDRAAHADLNILNDPTNLERFQQVAPAAYISHAYDPARHHPRPARDGVVSDFCFVGTGYPSRIEFFESIDWTGIDASFGGNWQALTDGSSLRPFVAHKIEHCLENSEAIEMYAGTKASANLYRKEASHNADGWAMGPREIELAACGTFYLTEERGENREALPMVPTFTESGDFAEKLRWYLKHDGARAWTAKSARAAIADRTFVNNARQLLGLIEKL